MRPPALNRHAEQNLTDMLRMPFGRSDCIDSPNLSRNKRTATSVDERRARLPCHTNGLFYHTKTPTANKISSQKTEPSLIIPLEAFDLAKGKRPFVGANSCAVKIFVT